ncbi:MAG: hypothetical protein U1F40_00595 [Turneriella sp.]
MSYRKKFRVTDLRRSDSFAESQGPVLAHYLKRVLKQAKIPAGPGGAPQPVLRIQGNSLCALELYATELSRVKACMNWQSRLQNTLGDRRDIDVMHERLLSLYRNGEYELLALIGDIRLQ